MNMQEENQLNKFFLERNKQLSLLIENEGFKGYSLYDSNNSVIDFTNFGHRINFVVNQVVKRGPSWTRKLLGVRKGINPKLLGLYLLYSNNPTMIDECINIALNNRNDDGAWGYNYTWPRGDGSLIKKGLSNVVVTYFVFMGLRRHRDRISQFEKLEHAVSKFLNNLVLFEEKEEACFSYFPKISNKTLNASLFAAELLLSVENTSDNRRLAEKCIEFVINRQNHDGSYPYSENIKTGNLKNQYDFHQYYVLASLKRLCAKLELSKYSNSIETGLNYLIDFQLNHGIFYWRYPKKYPVDIHNQAAAILALRSFKTELNDLNVDADGLLNKVVRWNEKHMWDGTKYYYQYYPLITIKTNYLRWNQGWMLAASSKNHTYSI